ncbi:EpsG family protein [Prevotella sp. AGR2160]|uniref:EpsG family protein n=1 Tax=Prevotella sp. AGR2160 TaxID=1280674 RepID=UPI0003F86B4B|nr:EpsG family protein [Prevotella sp. AGR2160]
MIIIVFSLAVIVAVLFLLEDYLGPYKLPIYLVLVLIFILVAGFKDMDSVNDAYNYEFIFEHYDDPILAKGVEFSYLWISKIFYHWFHDVRSIFLFYAILGVSLKFIAFRKLSPIIFLPVLFYLSNYYLLHDLTQIRAAVASGFFLFSIYYLDRDKKIAFLLILCALFFHYSSAALIPLLVLKNSNIEGRKRYLWASIIPIGYILYFLHLNLLSFIPIPYLANKIEAYQSLAEKGIVGNEINVFNLVFLVRILIFYFNLYFLDTIKIFNQRTPLLLKIDAFSLFSFPALATIPAIAFRITELLGIVEILLMSNILYTIKQRSIANGVVIFAAFTLLMINVFYLHLLV